MLPLYHTACFAPTQSCAERRGLAAFRCQGPRGRRSPAAAIQANQQHGSIMVSPHPRGPHRVKSARLLPIIGGLPKPLDQHATPPALLWRSAKRYVRTAYGLLPTERDQEVWGESHIFGYSSLVAVSVESFMQPFLAGTDVRAVSGPSFGRRQVHG